MHCIFEPPGKGYEMINKRKEERHKIYSEYKARNWVKNNKEKTLKILRELGVIE